MKILIIISIILLYCGCGSPTDEYEIRINKNHEWYQVTKCVIDSNSTLNDSLKAQEYYE